MLRIKPKKGNMAKKASESTADEIKDAIETNQVGGEDVTDKIKSVGKKKGKKQPDLPAMKGEGVEQPNIPDIDDAIQEYQTVRDKRMKLTPIEVEAKKKLMALMKHHGVVRYNYTDDEDELRAAVIQKKDETVKLLKLSEEDVSLE